MLVAAAGFIGTVLIGTLLIHESHARRAQAAQDAQLQRIQAAAQVEQHKVNGVVWAACKSDTVAEQNANVIVHQLRMIIHQQENIALRMGLTNIALRDHIIAESLPRFPPLPPCGTKP